MDETREGGLLQNAGPSFEKETMEYRKINAEVASRRVMWILKAKWRSEHPFAEENILKKDPSSGLRSA